VLAGSLVPLNFPDTAPIRRVEKRREIWLSPLLGMPETSEDGGAGEFGAAVSLLCGSRSAKHKNNFFVMRPSSFLTGVRKQEQWTRLGVR
jgi:hypothetical protein